MRNPRWNATSRALRGGAWCLGLLGLCALSWVGCAPAGGLELPAGVLQASGAGSTRAFLDRISSAPMDVAYGGRRHVLVNYTVAGAPSTLEYDEDVWSDGQGNFAIVPGQVYSPPMTVEEEQFFAILQEKRDGFFYRYRDFRVRDARLFLLNWSSQDTGIQESVAGRTTFVLDFRRADGVSTWYRAWIDPRTGLVMRSEERDEGGQLVSRVEFVTFTLDPNLTGVPLHGERYPPASLNLQADTTSLIGFQVLAPTLLPRGYRLERSESLSDGTSNWARLCYGDGVEQIFFLQTRVPAGPWDPNEIDVGPKSVRVFQVGPWTVLQLRVAQDRVTLLGKVGETGLLRMLKSAVH